MFRLKPPLAIFLAAFLTLPLYGDACTKLVQESNVSCLANGTRAIESPLTAFSNGGIIDITSDTMDSLYPPPPSGMAQPAAGTVTKFQLVVETGTIDATIDGLRRVPSDGGTHFAQPTGPTAALVFRSQAAGVYHYEATFTSHDVAGLTLPRDVYIVSPDFPCADLAGTLGGTATSNIPLPVASDTLFPAFPPTLNSLNAGFPFTAATGGPVNLTLSSAARNFDPTFLSVTSGTPFLFLEALFTGSGSTSLPLPAPGLRFSVDACVDSLVAPVAGNYNATFISRFATGTPSIITGTAGPINGTPRAGDLTCPASTHLSFPSDPIYSTAYTAGGAIGIVLTK